MPLTELMNYFNDQLQTQSKLHSLPKNGFFKLADGFGARFGNLILSADFQKIIYRNEYLYAFYGDLSIRCVTGNKLNIHDVFSSLDSKEQIVHLDRLSRTLLSLNFLQKYDQSSAKLFLPVHPRHIASVQSDHGRIFEIILEDCGLVPSRVSLYTHLNSNLETEHFLNALLNYKEKGYLISLEVNTFDDIEFIKFYGNNIDFCISKKQFLNSLYNLKQDGYIAPETALILKQQNYAATNLADFVMIKNEIEEKIFDIEKNSIG